MRLIDADELLYEKGAVEVTEFKEAIESCKTVDTERHGHWKKPRNPFLNQSHFTEARHWYCSCCDYEIIRHKVPNYCENCGAKMDEVIEE